MRELGVGVRPALSPFTSTCRLVFTPSDDVAGGTGAAPQGLHSSTGGTGTTATRQGEFGASTPW